MKSVTEKKYDPITLHLESQDERDMMLAVASNLQPHTLSEWCAVPQVTCANFLVTLHRLLQQ